jgi:hypothetical protein
VTDQLYVAGSHSLFGIDKLVVETFKGMQPEFGLSVKLGVIGDSMQTFFVIVSLPQAFRTIIEI